MVNSWRVLSIKPYFILLESYATQRPLKASRDTRDHWATMDYWWVKTLYLKREREIVFQCITLVIQSKSRLSLYSITLPSSLYEITQSKIIKTVQIILWCEKSIKTTYFHQAENCLVCSAIENHLKKGAPFRKVIFPKAYLYRSDRAIGLLSPLNYLF